MNLFSQTVQRVDKAFRKNEFDRSKVWKTFYIGPEGTKDEKGQPIDVPDEYAQELVSTYPDRYFTEDGWKKYQEIAGRNQIEPAVTSEPDPSALEEAPEEPLNEGSNKPTQEELEELTVATLKGIAAEMGLTVPDKIIKMDLIKLIMDNA